MSNKIFSTFCSIDGQHITIVVVGDEGTSKHELSKSLADMVMPYRVNVHTCNSLPAPEGSHLYSVRVDFLCFVLHQANKESLKTVQESLGQVDVSYFLGRSTIIVNTKGEQHDENIHPNVVKCLGQKYGIPVLSGDIEDELEKRELSRKIKTMVEIACGLKRNLSPLLI